MSALEEGMSANSDRLSILLQAAKGSTHTKLGNVGLEAQITPSRRTNLQTLDPLHKNPDAA